MNAPQTALHNMLAGMERFHEIVDGAAILVSKAGVYRQVKVFSRGGEVYAGSGTGFIRLFRDGNEMSHQLALMISAKVDWLSRFAEGKSKRPDHEIERKRYELSVLNQAAGDYRAAAERAA